MHACACVHAGMRACACVHVHVCMFARACACEHVHVSIALCVHVHVSIALCVHVHVCIALCVHVCACACVWGSGRVQDEYSDEEVHNEEAHVHVAVGVVEDGTDVEVAEERASEGDEGRDLVIVLDHDGAQLYIEERRESKHRDRKDNPKEDEVRQRL